MLAVWNIMHVECSNHIQLEGKALCGYARVHYSIQHLQGCIVTRVVSEFDHCIGHVAVPHIIMQGNIYHDNISRGAINIT